tara:strand:+ start:1345 stop:1632 length:288 start_codon:yes stop_codon:yes gene_type:complete
MSHIRKRTCEPNFLINERGANASIAASDYSRAQNDADLYAISVLTPRMLRKKVSREYEILQSKIEEFVASDGDLKAMALELVDLNTRINGLSEDD